MKDDTLELFFLLIILALIALLTLVGLSYAAEPPHVGVWVGDRCCLDCYEEMRDPGAQLCMELVYLQPDPDFALGDHIGSDYNTKENEVERHVSPVPEPMTILMVGSGLVYLTMKRRK